MELLGVQTEIGMSVEDEDQKDKNTLGLSKCQQDDGKLQARDGLLKKNAIVYSEDGSTLKDDRIRQSITGYAIKI